MPQKPMTIHPTDAQDERLAQVPLPAAYTYAYLPTVLDDEGRVRDQPAVLNGYLWPLRADEHPIPAMADDLRALVEHGLLCRYEVAGNSYLHDPQWKARHRPSGGRTSSDLPPCPVHAKAFDDLIGEALGKVSEQVNSLLGGAGPKVTETVVRDVIGRFVEDVTFLVDPDKAASYGAKVRDLFEPTRRTHLTPVKDVDSERPRQQGETPVAAPQHRNSSAAEEGKDVWSDATDDPDDGRRVP